LERLEKRGVITENGKMKEFTSRRARKKREKVGRKKSRDEGGEADKGGAHCGRPWVTVDLLSRGLSIGREKEVISETG